MLKKKSTDDIVNDERVDDIFIARARGESIVLLDSGTKTIECLSDHLPPNIKAGAVVHVIGRAISTGGRMKILCDSIEPVDHFSLDGLLKPQKKDLSAMREELFNAIDSVKDEEIKALLTEIFNSEERFFVYPGSLEIHHAWRGGLIQHTLEVLNYALLAGEMHGMDRDLLVAGSLLHDIGKVLELDNGIRISREGRLLGHITLGVIYVSNRCLNMKIKEEKRDKILHIIASHYGKLEYGSPREPMFPEAFAVYHADELSAKLSRISEFVEAHKEDDFVYSVRDKRSIYLR